eukprot:TRINITY_DN63143_c0_g1_i1.p1 TRINITY_DN63143_c0_g1~~TRINITY_DN63143_c0_g1_i1.p1  ORF type:complete len:679 (+),score=113.17 TRINITY_DN63143_c0_g1_i1:81-2117(+)
MVPACAAAVVFWQAVIFAGCVFVDDIPKWQRIAEDDTSETLYEDEAGISTGDVTDIGKKQNTFVKHFPMKVNIAHGRLFASGREHQTSGNSRVVTRQHKAVPEGKPRTGARMREVAISKQVVLGKAAQKRRLSLQATQNMRNMRQHDARQLPKVSLQEVRRSTKRKHGDFGNEMQSELMPSAASSLAASVAGGTLASHAAKAAPPAALASGNVAVTESVATASPVVEAKSASNLIDMALGAAAPMLASTAAGASSGAQIVPPIAQASPTLTTATGASSVPQAVVVVVPIVAGSSDISQAVKMVATQPLSTVAAVQNASCVPQDIPTGATTPPTFPRYPPSVPGAVPPGGGSVRQAIPMGAKAHVDSSEGLRNVSTKARASEAASVPRAVPIVTTDPLDSSGGPEVDPTAITIDPSDVLSTDSVIDLLEKFDVRHQGLLDSIAALSHAEDWMTRVASFVQETAIRGEADVANTSMYAVDRQLKENTEMLKNIVEKSLRHIHKTDAKIVQEENPAETTQFLSQAVADETEAPPATAADALRMIKVAVGEAAQNEAPRAVLAHHVPDVREARPMTSVTLVGKIDQTRPVRLGPVSFGEKAAQETKEGMALVESEDTEAENVQNGVQQYVDRGNEDFSEREEALSGADVSEELGLEEWSEEDQDEISDDLATEVLTQASDYD